MDRDRIEGSARALGGRVKALVGRLLGDPKMHARGEFDRIQGKLQNTVGRLKGNLTDDEWRPGR